MADDQDQAPTDEVDVTTSEPTLPGFELPEYHGKKPVGMKSSLNGAGNRTTRAHDLGEKVVLVIEARVKKAGHELTDDGVFYAESLKVTDYFEIQGAPGTRLLSTVRQAYRTAEDAVAGRAPLANDDVDLGATGVTDASGVVLTDDDAAELRGDPAAAIFDESRTPVVVVFSDQARDLWPDEFEAGAPRPVAGQRFLLDDDSEVHVRSILNAETGETVEQWTDEQEEAFLLDCERKLEAGEQSEQGKADYEEHERIRKLREEQAAERDGTPEVQVDPPGADGDVEGPDADPFPGAGTFAGDPPDEELEIDEADLDPELAAQGKAIVEDADGFADVVSIGEPVLPTTADFAFVDRKISELGDDVKATTDLDDLARLRKAEEQGRGRGLKPRAGVLELLDKRAAEIFSELKSIEPPDIGDAGDLEPGPDDDQHDDGPIE